MDVPAEDILWIYKYNGYIAVTNSVRRMFDTVSVKA